MEPSTLRLDVEGVLRFFDEKPDWSVKHATAIVSVLGEDLAAASLQHCLEANGATRVKVRPETVGTGKVRGPRLDRWIEADLSGGEKYLFQTEIKNWSAHAFGGKPVPLGIPSAEFSKRKRNNWGDLWNARSRDLQRKDVAKVLVKMELPKNTEGRKILPLLIFWHPVGPRSKSSGKGRVKGGHLFSVASPTLQDDFGLPPRGEFPELWVFSVSSYLRSLKQGEIELNMPQAAARLRALNKLVVPVADSGV